MNRVFRLLNSTPISIKNANGLHQVGMISKSSKNATYWKNEAQVGYHAIRTKKSGIKISLKQCQSYRKVADCLDV